MAIRRFGFFFALVAFLQISNIYAQSISAEQALKLLKEGNERFSNGKSTHPSYVAAARDKMLEKQTPFVAIVSCSDSRVPPEIIFDRGLGELFVVRDAGNVIGAIEMDSIEFAVAHLHVPLIVVLGHQNCGAIQAALHGQSHVPELENIFPLIDEAFKGCVTIGSNSLVNAIHCNVKKGVETLKKSPTIAPIFAKHQVKIIGAYYDIETGKVSFLTE
jgi:carbonic anhydrase